MKKDTIPEGFTLKLALVDALPVLFFGINCILIGRELQCWLFILGAILCFLGGAGKVLWKILVATRKINVWFLFVQMRVLMPIGFFMMIAGVVLLPEKAAAMAAFSGLLAFPCLLFVTLGILGMGLMCVFAVKLDNTDKKSNWIEQITNGISQACFFAALMLL